MGREEGGGERISAEGNEGTKPLEVLDSIGGGLSGEDKESKKGLNEELTPSWFSALKSAPPRAEEPREFNALPGNSDPGEMGIEEEKEGLKREPALLSVARKEEDVELK